VVAGSKDDGGELVYIAPLQRAAAGQTNLDGRPRGFVTAGQAGWYCGSIVGHEEVAGMQVVVQLGSRRVLHPPLLIDDQYLRVRRTLRWRISGSHAMDFPP